MKSIVKVLAVVLALAFVISLAACGKSGSSGNSNSKAEFIGTWENSEFNIVCTFNDNGTGTLDRVDSSVNFTYVDKGNVIEVTYDGATEVQSLDYTYDGTTLTIAGIPYTKK